MPSSPPDEVGVGDDAGVGVELAAVLQGREVLAALAVDQQDQLAGHAAAGSSRPVDRWRTAGRRSTGSLASGLLDQPAERADLAGARARRTTAQVPRLLLLLPARRRTGGRACRGTRSRSRTWCPGEVASIAVERLLVAEVAVAGRHRALLDMVVDAAQHAVGRRLPLGQAHERLDLAGEPVPRRQHRELAAEVVGRASAGRCRTARRPRRRGCGRWRRRRSRRRGRPCRTGGAWTGRRPSTAPAWSPGGRWGCRSRSSSAEVDPRCRRQAARRRRSARAYSPGLVAVVADAEAEVEAVGLVAELERGCPTAARESLPPDTATSTRSPGRIMSKSSMARCTCSRQWARKWSVQKLALWRRRSITAGSRHTRHFIDRRPRRSPGGSRRRRRRRAGRRRGRACRPG